MAELNKETGLLNYVEQNVHSFGQAKENDKISFEFKWLAPKSAIQYVESGCPLCTKAWYEDGKIVGYVELSKASGSAQGYLKGRTAIDKNVDVWINDGQERFVPNEKMQKTTNQLKPFVRLKIIGEVVV